MPFQLVEPTRPERARRQRRLDALASARFYDDDETVLPAVPMWGWLDADRAQSEVDHLGAGALATDWGQRLLWSRSERYDPLSYHYGSVWPLLTGWADGGLPLRPAPRRLPGADDERAAPVRKRPLGYVTELLSGDFQTALGRSSHHQVWSEATVATPLVRGLGFPPSSSERWTKYA